ncbi:DMT family transporter [Naumannella cuiyingiana]|nr:DMT family transporter [Naumannella cuiyingiana]
MRRGAADRTWLIALAAALWGFSGLLRAPLSRAYPSTSVVLWEHLFLVVLVSPLLPGAIRALRRSSARTVVAVLVIGGGSSALATTLFTAAFAYGDPISPQVLQKLQPLLAIGLAALLLGERVRGRFWLFAVPALAGAWLMAFPNPLQVGIRSLVPALLGVGAAALWALGTVLGRAVSAQLTFWQVTALRFAGGFVALVIINAALGTPMIMPVSTWGSILSLALIPGLAALLLYYHGLRRTAASRATLAELAFPLTAALVGVTLLGASLAPSQWVGLGVVLVSVVALALHEQRAERPAVRVPQPARTD